MNSKKPAKKIKNPMSQKKHGNIISRKKHGAAKIDDVVFRTTRPHGIHQLHLFNGGYAGLLAHAEFGRPISQPSS